MEETNSSTSPIPEDLSRKIISLAAGEAHTIALTGDGCVYSWGRGMFGRLGTGKESDELVPVRVEFEFQNRVRIVGVAAGAYHSLAVSEPVSQIPEHAYLVSVDCGLFHTSVVSSEGFVWSWGMERGLGLCPDVNFADVEAGDDSVPRKISGGSRFRDPVQVSCGAAHTVLVANGGYKLWSWGRGRNGVLGTGNVTDCYVPTPVFWPDELKPENEEVPEAEKNSATTEEVKRLEAKLMVMERYASILHGSIFGKPFNEEEDIPYSLRVSGYFDMGKEWGEILESADKNQLMRLQAFYEDMIVRVKDKVLQRRIQEIMKDCLQSSASKH